MALRRRVFSLAVICLVAMVSAVNLYGHAPHIQLSKGYVNFWGPPGGPNPQSQTIQLLNTTHARMPWTATVTYLNPPQAANWLILSCASVSAFCSTATPSPQQIGGEFPGIAPCCGAESTNFVLSISLNPKNPDGSSAPLAAGVYYATITISAPGAPDVAGLPNAPPADNTPQVMEVALTVSPTFQYAPGIGVSPPQSVDFNGASGTDQSFTQAVSVGNLGGGTLNWTAAVDSASKNWLSVSSQLANEFMLTASVGSLPSGTYMGNVIITVPGAANSPKSIPVTFNIRHPLPANIQLGTTSLQFSAIPNAGNPPSQKLTITNTGDLSVNWKAQVTSSDGGSWLAVFPDSGTDSGIITVTTTTGALDPGTYLGKINITAPGALNSPNVQVTFIVAPPRPVLTQNGVVNAATFMVGSVAPGEIVSLFGANLGPPTPVVATLDANNQLPTTLGGTTVTFNGVSAPLYFVSGGQVNLQVPYEVANQSSAAITVTPAGLSPASVTIPVADVALGIFAIGTRAAALNQDYSVNTISNPAAPGSVIMLYITGQGVVNPKVATGATAPSTPPFPVPKLQPVGVTMNGLQAKVDFAGLAPGFVGLTQVNAEIPQALAPSDNVSVSVGIGFNQAPASVLIAVR